MNIKKHIPNFLTCCNLLCGCLGIFLVLQGKDYFGAYLIWAALLLDFLDGFTARMLKVSSPIGKELDSLADLVTFGVLPGFMMLLWMRSADLPSYVPFIAFLIPVFSALRLANFNVDERQTTDFIGLPTPANALFISSLVFVADSPMEWLRSDYVLVLITLLFSYLLVSPIRMFSLKTTSFGWKGNELKIIFLVLCIALLAIFRLSAFPMIIILYVTLSLFFNRKQSHNEIKRETF